MTRRSIFSTALASITSLFAAEPAPEPKKEWDRNDFAHAYTTWVKRENEFHITGLVDAQAVQLWEKTKQEWILLRSTIDRWYREGREMSERAEQRTFPIHEGVSYLRRHGK